MGDALHHEATEHWIARIRSGEEQALCRLHAALQRRFLPFAMSFLEDAHEAQAAFDDAFMKFQARLTNGGFTYQGEGRFYAYFRSILRNVCRDRYRKDKPRRDWEEEHLLPSAPAEGDGEEALEYIERAVGYNPQVEEAEMWRNSRFHEELEQFLETSLTPQDRRFWEAYRVLTETPGSDQWGDHKKTGFLKQYLGLPGSAFCPAHTRFRQRIEHFGRQWGLVKRSNSKEPSSA